MILKIEGCDGCYKTTVANLLKERLGFPIVRGSSFELAQCSNEELYQHFRELSKSENIIMDRGIYSNLVYASLYEDYAILTEEQRLKLEEMYKPKTIVIYLYAPSNVIKDRINVRGDDYVKNEMIDKIVNRYEEVLEETIVNNRVPILMYDTSELSSEGIAERIEHAIKNFYRGNE